MRAARDSESENSDVHVIEDEDLEMARQIEKERKAKRAQKLKEKREKEGKPPPKRRPEPKRRRMITSDEEESEDESSKKPTKKHRKRAKSSDSEDGIEEDYVKPNKKNGQSSKKTRPVSSDDQDSEDYKSSKGKKNYKSRARKSSSRSQNSETDEEKYKVKEKQKKKSEKEVRRSKKSDSEDSEDAKPLKKSQKPIRNKGISSGESDESDFERVKKPKKVIKKSWKKRPESDKSDEEDSAPKMRKPVRRKRLQTSSEESTESEGTEHSGDSDARNTNASRKPKNKSVASLSSDESEMEVMPQKKKRGAMISDSDDDENYQKKSKKTPQNSSSESDDEKDTSKKKIIVSNLDSGSDSSEGSIIAYRRKNNKRGKPEKKKKGIIMDSSKLAKETVDAERAEKERRKRLEKKQKEFNGIVLEEGEDLTEILTGTSSQRKLKSVVLDPDATSDPNNREPVEVHNSLVRILKPHQAHGIQFMYDCAFESLDRLDTEGSGGILAHCMGLGKTLQVITFLHTILMHDKIGQKCKRILVVVPKNVIINWFKEFQKWLCDNDEELDTIEVNELDSCKTLEDRRRSLMHWHSSESPSVMIIGYDLFRILTAEDDPKKKKPKNKNRRLAKVKDIFRKCLQDPGPDMVVCDEAHKLKNDESALSKCMVKIQTKRRICLTGTPLQNNLMEYHCMVNFVKPGLLGTKTEFANRFVNIINRGRTKDASALEVSFMKRRCHVLYEHLKKCVDRKDYRVLTEAIPPKQEYVINVRLTERQCKLYSAFLNDMVGSAGLSKRLLADYHMFSRIWTHPYQLVIHEQKLERERVLKEDAEEEADFIDDGDESESDSSGSYQSESESEESSALSSDDEGKSKKKKKKNTNKNKKSASKRNRSIGSDNEEDSAMSILQNGIRQSKRLAGEDIEDIRDTDTPPEYTGWFSKLELVNEDDRDDFSLSNKLILLMEIIKKCEEIGDKLLIFSQSLESLSLIKRMLEYMVGTGQWFSDGHEALNAEGETWSWLEGEDYMTIDGSVQSGKRDAVQTAFNDPENFRARLMLISTRAGSLGTNMVSANRVVIFDACWNPSHDTQSLFRVYRFGQTKPVYIYRFIAQGTMEERIYKRQVTKESTSMRVVDEAQIQRHYLGHDLTELYQFTPAEYDPDIEFSCAPPKDRLLAEVIHKNQCAVVDYIEHDTLFANVEEEKLTEQEMKEAWTDYEKDKNGVSLRAQYAPPMPGFPNGMIVGHNVQAMLQNRMNEGMRVDQMQHDVLFKELQKMRAKDMATSVKIVLLRNLLEQMLPYIPDEIRGGMSEFNTHFIRLVHDTDRRNETPADLLRKSLESFKTVVKMVRAIPSCREPLARMARTYPYLFAE